MSSIYKDQSAAAQASFSGLSQALLQARVDRCVTALPGGFSRKHISGRDYWYHQQKSPDGVVRQIYVGPDSDAVRGLVEQHANRPEIALSHLRDLSKACVALGCYSVIPAHFRVLQRMADHGLFEAGAMLVGAHAFLAYQNHLGVSWSSAGSTVDLDFAHPGRNVSVAIVPEARMDAPSAIESLRMGFVPIVSGTTYKKADEPDFDLDFLTSRVTRGDKPIDCPALNLKLQPMRFMEFSLEAPVQCALIGSSGSTLVNLPQPQRYAVHKLLICHERPESQAGKARKDVAQAAILMRYLSERDPSALVDAWQDASSRGPSWRKSLAKGVKKMLAERPAMRSVVKEIEDQLKLSQLDAEAPKRVRSRRESILS